MKSPENQETEASLKDFFNNLSADQQAEAEADILNAGNLPSDVLEKITNLEAARGIMNRIRTYLDMKENPEMDKKKLKDEASEITALLDRKLDEATV